MTQDERPEDEDIRETYHKVDKRDYLHDDVAAAEPAADPSGEETAADAGAGEGLEIDTYGVLRLCLGMFVEQAWVQLGLQLAPGAQETTTDLKQAKLAIDTVAYMADALGENLLPEERREVDQILATLRLNYVQRA